MVEIERGHDLLVQPRLRIVGDPHVVFLEHDVALGQHVLVLEDEAGHAVGLELHHQRQLLARDALEVAGVVVRGEGVLVAADLQHGLRELAGRMLRGALEHQMFEEMRESRFAGRLVGRADLVPDHLRHDRRAMILDHHDLKPVRQGEGGRRLRGEGGLRRRGGGRQNECCEQRGCERFAGHHDLYESPNESAREQKRRILHGAANARTSRSREKG